MTLLDAFKLLALSGCPRTAASLWSELYALLVAEFEDVTRRTLVTNSDADTEAAVRLIARLGERPAAQELRQMFEFLSQKAEALGLTPKQNQDIDSIRFEITGDAAFAVLDRGELTSWYIDAWRELLMFLWDDADGKIFAEAMQHVREESGQR
jgi:hypothetical protein